MLVKFTLTMPVAPTCNGRWSGEGKLCAIVTSIRPNKAKEICENSPYYHYWEDGWIACIDAEPITANDARKIRKASAGFCGYDWMVKNIIQHGRTKS